MSAETGALDTELQDLIARRDIQKALSAYMRGQDRLLPELHLSAFHENAWVDCGLFAGTASEFVDFAQGFLADCDATQHLIGQVDLEISGEIATGEVYFIAQHRITQAGDKYDLFVAGRYHDEYARIEGRWAITKRKEIVDWARTDPAADSFLKDQPELHRAQRGFLG